MLPGMEMLACPNLAVSPQVMQHIVRVESDANPFAIGVVGGKLARQPHTMEEALATARMLESKGYNFSVGIAQINRANLGRHGLDSYRKAFNACDNLAAGARILADCYDSAHGDWGKAFSCYYSGNFTTGFRDGYVQKVYASINRDAATRPAAATPAGEVPPIPLTNMATAATMSVHRAAPRPVPPPSSDSAGYRVALRSVAVDAAAAALAPLVVSSVRQDSQSEPVAVASTGAPSAPLSANELAAAPEQRPGNAQLPDAPTQRATPSTIAEVFKPAVRGPNDPPAAAAAPGQPTTAPHTDGADFHREQRDAAFVF